MEDNDKNTPGIPGLWTPGEIAFNPYITKTEKYLYSVIVNLAQTERGCWATNDFLASIIDCTKSRTSVMITKLENYKYIKIKRVRMKEGYTERRIYKNNFEGLYTVLAQKFNGFMLTREKTDIQQLLRETVINICCPNNPDKFDKDKGFLSVKGVYRDVNGGLHTGKPPFTHRETGVNPSVKHNSNREGNIEGNRESLEYKYSKEKGSPEPLPFRRAKKLLNRKKQTRPKINIVNKQQRRLELDIDNIEQACPDARKLFLYWNTLKVAHHRDTCTKTKFNSYRQIQKALAKHAVKDVRAAFDTYSSLTEQFPVKFSKMPYKVSLPDFFSWGNQLRDIATGKKDLQRLSGLFEVCVLGLDYALDYFGSKKTISNVSRTAVESMIAGASRVFSTQKVKRAQGALERAAVRLEDLYAKRARHLNGLGKKGSSSLVPLLWDYIEASNDVEKFKLWWVNSDNTFDGFEQWLEDNGYLKETSRYHKADTKYGEDGRVVRCRL